MTDLLHPTDTRPYLLEQIDDAAVVQLYADGFAALPLAEKVLVWHLYCAAIEGRDIYYDQRYRHNLVMRRVLEAVITHPQGIPEPVLAEITRYTKLFWLNTGPYNNLTARKFVLNLAEAEMAAAVTQAHANGAALPLGGGESPAMLVSRLAPLFLDPTVDPMVTSKTPGEGRDILQCSANNLYEGVAMADLEGFNERHPLELTAGEARRTAGRGGVPRRRPLPRRDRPHHRPPAGGRGRGAAGVASGARGARALLRDR